MKITFVGKPDTTKAVQLLAQMLKEDLMKAKEQKNAS